MINENLEVAKADVNAKVIADMDKAQASFMEARAEKRKAEEMKKENIFSKLMADKQNNQTKKKHGGRIRHG